MLGGQVGIFSAAALRDKALGALQDEKALTVCVNLAETHSLDVSALQILCALRDALQAAGRTFTLEAVPANLAVAWQKIGVVL